MWHKTSIDLYIVILIKKCLHMYPAQIISRSLLCNNDIIKPVYVHSTTLISTTKCKYNNVYIICTAQAMCRCLQFKNGIIMPQYVHSTNRLRISTTKYKYNNVY